MPGEAILLNGSLCLTDLVELAKQQHPAISRSQKNNKVYVNFTMWVNEDADQYGNHASLQLNPKKEEREAAIAKYGKCYFGNAKKSDKQGGAPVGDANDLDINGVAGGNASQGGAPGQPGGDQPGGLPF